MARWGMIIDLRKCIGCQTCEHVCEQFNFVPAGTSWRQVVEIGREGGRDMDRIFLPMNCMHCSDAPCLKVCPSSATYRRPDGIVDIRQELCVGCGFCIVACPYRARTIAKQDKVLPAADHAATGTGACGPDRIGICTKCNFCLSKIDEGLAKGLQPGRDPEATPNCVSSCLGLAMHFGDLDDPASSISQVMRENTVVSLQDDLGTKPAVYYVLR